MNNISDLDIEKSMREILRAESQAILNIPVTDAYALAVSIILDRVHARGGKLVASGMGKAGQIAMNIATTFVILLGDVALLEEVCYCGGGV